MDCTPPSKKMLRLEFPYHRIQTYLAKLSKLKEAAALSSHTKQGKEALNWLRKNANLVLEVTNRAKEPYYKTLPYRNRSDGMPGWQFRIIWDAPKWKGRVACGANRIGKSQLGAFETALVVTGEHPTYKTPDQGRAWVVGPDSKMLAAVERPYFEKMLPKRYFENGKWNGKHEYWTVNADGREWEVWFKSCDSGRAKFQGDAIDYAWVDEEPLKEGVFDELEMRLIDRRGKWLMTATPVEGTKWLKDQIDDEDVGYTLAGMRENPYICLDEIERAARKLSADERAVRVDGKYLIFGGRPVFDRQKVAELEALSLPFMTGSLMVA